MPEILTLADDEAALIVKAEGHVEMRLPQMEGDDAVPVPFLVLITAAMRMSDEAYLTAMLDWLHAQNEETANGE